MTGYPSDRVRVLVVDDDEHFRNGLTELLTAHGLDVIATAGDARDAIDVSRMLRPDVVLMDVEMPGPNGIQATPGVLQACPEAKVRARVRQEAGQRLGDLGEVDDPGSGNMERRHAAHFGLDRADARRIQPARLDLVSRRSLLQRPQARQLGGVGGHDELAAQRVRHAVIPTETH